MFLRPFSTHLCHPVGVEDDLLVEEAGKVEVEVAMLCMEVCQVTDLLVLRVLLVYLLHREMIEPEERWVHQEGALFRQDRRELRVRDRPLCGIRGKQTL